MPIFSHNLLILKNILANQFHFLKLSSQTSPRCMLETAGIFLVYKKNSALSHGKISLDSRGG